MSRQAFLCRTTARRFLFEGRVAAQMNWERYTSAEGREDWYVSNQSHPSPAEFVISYSNRYLISEPASYTEVS